MEFFAFLGLIFVVAVAFIWRSRRGTTNDIDSLTKGLPDDLRDKDAGFLGSHYGGGAGIGGGHIGGGGGGAGGGGGGGNLSGGG